MVTGVAILLASRVGAQAPAYLVKDIDTAQAVREPAEDEPSSDPRAFAALDGVVYFVAGDSLDTYGEPAFGEELWRTDGTAAGTWLVRDLNPGAGGSAITGLQTHGGRLYFLATDGDHHGLWRSDGTAGGTVLVAAIGEPTRRNLLARLGDGWLAFVEQAHGDGGGLVGVTDAGEVTRLGQAISSFDDNPPSLAIADGVAYFAGYDSEHGYNLWRTDGTVAGTGMAADLGPFNGGPREIVAVGSRVLCTAVTTASPLQLLAVDGGRVTSIIAGQDERSAPRHLTAFGDIALFFTGGEYYADRVLWRSDGTAEGTQIIGTPTGDTLTPFVPFAGALYFGVGFELWRTDGTAAGTRRVADYRRDDDRSYSPYVSVADAGDALYVTVHQRDGVDLWRSDGTRGRGALLRSFAGGTTRWDGTAIGAGRVTGSGRFVFAADDTGGIEPWITDGSAAGTQLLRDINRGATDFTGDFPGQSSFVDAGGTLLFYADDRTGAQRFLWRSDGTAAGTRRIDATPADFYDYYPLVAIGPTAFLRFGEPDTGAELWSVSAPDGPARRVTDLAPGPASSDAYIVGTIDGNILLSASDGISGVELWTPAGDGLVRDIAPGPQSSTPYWATGAPVVASLNGFLYFFTVADGQGLQLWRSDASSSGTTLVATLSGDGAYYDPIPVIVAGRDRLAVIARVGDRLPSDPMVGIWYSDGTPEGTTLVARAHAQRDYSGSYEYWPRLLGFAGRTLLFARPDTALGVELWRSDGTAAGTGLLADLNPGSGDSAPTGGVALGDRLLFFADDGVHGREPWISDGGDDTHLLLDLTPGLASSRRRFDPTPLLVGDVAVFAAADAEHGRELWRSDGTAAGTALLADVAAGAASAAPGSLTVSGSRLFFTANDGVHGRELWAIDLADVGCTLPCSPPTPEGTPRPTWTAGPPRPTWTSGPPRPTLTPTPTPTERPIEQCLASPDSGCAVLTLGTVTGAPGSTVELPAVLTTGGLAVAGIQLDENFTDDVTTTPGDCRVAPGIDKQLYAATPASLDLGVRLILLSLTNVDPLPDGMLLSCTYRIAADATPGRHPIACSGEEASTPDGNPITEAFRCRDGAVIVAAPAAPTATPRSGAHESVGGSASRSGCQLDPRPSAASALPLLPLALLLVARRRIVTTQDTEGLRRR